jgi:glucosyl-3-phosphoglycerate synthase
VVVIDDGSSDGTADAAAWRGEGLPVDVARRALGSGKGNAPGSLFVTEGDLVCWVDADIRTSCTHFVKSLLEPLLMDPASAS